MTTTPKKRKAKIMQTAIAEPTARTGRKSTLTKPLTVPGARQLDRRRPAERNGDTMKATVEVYVPVAKPGIVPPVEFDLEGYKTIVDYVIQKRYQGSLTSFAQELSLVTGHYVTRQKIDGWRVRGQFPVDWIEVIRELTRIPIRALLQRTMQLPR
jgi:hypothetical protein